MRAVLTGLFILLTACSQEPLPYPWLQELDAGDAVKASGERLMGLPYGLHSLEKETGTGRLLVGVHGYASEGYEWVYPLQTLDDQETAIYFYRWDWSNCPGSAAKALENQIRQLVDATRPETLTLVGHSYGGVLVTQLVTVDFGLPAEIHAVAAPVADLGLLNETCGYRVPESIGNGISYSQWRTQHQLDGAFSDLPVDPQIVEIPGNQVTDLPDTYRDRRLGHNWSISWVADRLSQSQ